MSGPISGAVRLLDEDPDGWRVYGDVLFHRVVGYRIRSGPGGPDEINGYALGPWRRFVLRQAVWRRERAVVSRYLEKRAAEKMAFEEAEADRLLADRS